MTFSATVSPLTGFHGVDCVLVNKVLPSPIASDLEANASVRRPDGLPGALALHAEGGQPLQVPGDQRLAAHRQQRLGRVVGERPHPLPLARREHQGLHAQAPCGRDFSPDGFSRRASGLKSLPQGDCA